jgi:hypothetical protein
MYLALVICVTYFTPIECLEERDAAVNNETTTTTTTTSVCQSVGVDNTIVNWVSSFFVGLCCLLFALHLSSFAFYEIRKSSIVTLVFMAGSFIVMGLASVLYPNNGMDDNYGMLGYWIMFIAHSIFFTISGLSMAHLSISVTKYMNPIRPNMCCATNSPANPTQCFPNIKIVALCELLLVLSLSGVLMGGIWCSLTPDIQVLTAMDEYEPTTEINVCYSIMYWSDISLKITYAILWVPVGFLLKAACQQRSTTVLGLPTPIAACTAIVLQWSVGSSKYSSGL